MGNFQALALFSVGILGVLALDLGLFHRQSDALSFRASLVRSAVWIALALASGAALYVGRGLEPALEFLTAYILEESLSLDNVFVFAVIFSSAAVPAEHQPRVLFWGVLGALVMRALLIGAGLALVARFRWILYFFGALLVVTGAKILLQKRGEPHVERNPVLRLARKLLPVTEGYEGKSFFVRRNGRLFATPLLLVMVMVETTDVLFALDSVPAVFAVTEDPLIVYTSNIFAVVGLRAMYFLLAGALLKFRYLRSGLSLVLILVGTKMLVARFYKISTLLSLIVICATLAGAIVLSLGDKERSKATGGDG